MVKWQLNKGLINNTTSMLQFNKGWGVYAQGRGSGYAWFNENGNDHELPYYTENGVRIHFKNILDGIDRILYSVGHRFGEA